MAKYDFFGDYKPHYEANIWVLNGSGDPLLIEKFTTKSESIACIKEFKKTYKGKEQLDCYVNHFDETECVDNFWEVC